MQEEIEKEKEQMKSGFIGGNSESSECMTFEQSVKMKIFGFLYFLFLYFEGE